MPVVDWLTLSDSRGYTMNNRMSFLQKFKRVPLFF